MESFKDRFFRSQNQWLDPLNHPPGSYLEDQARAGHLAQVGPESGLPPRIRPSMDQAVQYHLQQKAHWGKVEAERNELRTHADILLREREQLFNSLNEAKDTIVTMTDRLKQQNSKRVVIDEHHQHTSDRTDEPRRTVVPNPPANPSKQQQEGSSGHSGMPVEVLPTAGDADPGGHANEHDATE